MHKHILFQGLANMNDYPGRYRWDIQYHYPEIVRRFGPWLQRFERYLAVPPPPEMYPDIERFGNINFGLTVGWWLDIPGPPDGSLAFTPPKFGLGRGGMCYIPWKATEDFMGGEVTPAEKTVLRWVTLFKYPEGVPVEEGEDWYLNVHAKEVMQQPGLTRFFSSRTLSMSNALPGFRPPPGKVGVASPWVRVTDEPLPWVRVTEQWYENFDGWHKSVIEKPPKYTKPPWANYHEYPFLKPAVDFWSIFVMEFPTQDILKDYNHTAFTL